MKDLRIVLIVSIVLSISGCAASKQYVKIGNTHNNQMRQRKTLKKVYEMAKNVSKEEFSGLSSKFKVDSFKGYTKPYIPVIEQPKVKKAWIPAHKSSEDSNVLIAGHWVYLKISDFNWFIDDDKEEQINFPVIVPKQPIKK